MSAATLAAGGTDARVAVRSRSLRPALAIVSVAALLRLLPAVIVAPPADETYYWQWSRHLAFGYFDHPPGIALLVRAGTSIFGDTLLGLRAGAVLAGWGASICVLLLAARLGGGRAATRAALLLACMPLAAAGLALATPDAPLLLFVAATLLATDLAVSSEPGSRSATIWWAVAGLALGAALVSKYTAVLVPVAVLVALLAVRPLRRQLATPGPWLAVAVALALFAPVLAWNAAHGWVSFQFQLVHGLGAPEGSPLERELSLLGGQLGIVSPVLFVLLAAATVAALRRGAPRERLLAIVSAGIFLFFCATALRKPAEANWQATAYVGAIALAGAFDGGSRWRRWFAIGCALGAAMVLTIYVQSVHPFLPVAARSDPTARGEGWDDLARRVGAAADSVQAATGARAWLGGNRYQDASEIAFHLPTHPTTFSLDIGDRANEYALWPGFPALARPGDALIVSLGGDSDASDPVIRALAPHFASVTPLAVTELRRGDEVRTRRRAWVLSGWRGSWPR